MRSISRSAFVAFVAILALIFSGCSGSSSPPNPVELSGHAIKGLVAGGTVNAYSVDGNGDLGILIDTDITQADGSFIIDVGSFRGDLYLEVVGGTYINEATGIERPLTSPLRAVFSDVNSETQFVVTPLTELAILLSPSLAPDDVAEANALVSETIGGVNLNGQMPADVTGSVSGQTLSAIDYGLILAALCQWMDDANLSLEQALLLLANDLADFKLDTTARLSAMP